MPLHFQILRGRFQGFFLKLGSICFCQMACNYLLNSRGGPQSFDFDITYLYFKLYTCMDSMKWVDAFQCIIELEFLVSSRRHRTEYLAHQELNWPLPSRRWFKKRAGGWASRWKSRKELVFPWGEPCPQGNCPLWLTGGGGGGLHHHRSGALY